MRAAHMGPLALGNPLSRSAHGISLLTQGATAAWHHKRCMPIIRKKLASTTAAVRRRRRPLGGEKTRRGRTRLPSPRDSGRPFTERWEVLALHETRIDLVLLLELEAAIIGVRGLHLAVARLTRSIVACQLP